MLWFGYFGGLIISFILGNFLLQRLGLRSSSEDYGDDEYSPNLDTWLPRPFWNQLWLDLLAIRHFREN